SHSELRRRKIRPTTIPIAPATMKFTRPSVVVSMCSIVPRLHVQKKIRQREPPAENAILEKLANLQMHSLAVRTGYAVLGESTLIAAGRAFGSLKVVDERTDFGRSSLSRLRDFTREACS